MGAMTELLGPLGRARLVPARRWHGPNSYAQAACLAYWHVEFYRPPGILVADQGAAAGPGMHTVAGLRAMVSAEAPRFYTVSCITLADLPGVPAASKALDHFTHELIVFTLEADHAGYEAPTPWPYLQPHNVSVQWEDAGDDAARDTTRHAVAALLYGLLPPEVQAYVPQLHRMQTVVQLRAVWEDTVRATAEHHTTGGTHNLGH